MIKVNVVLEGKDNVAVLAALEEVKTAIKKGIRCCADNCDNGSYQFDSTDSRY